MIKLEAPSSEYSIVYEPEEGSYIAFFQHIFISEHNTYRDAFAACVQHRTPKPVDAALIYQMADEARNLAKRGDVDAAERLRGAMYAELQAVTAQMREVWAEQIAQRIGCDTSRIVAGWQSKFNEYGLIW